MKELRRALLQALALGIHLFLYVFSFGSVKAWTRNSLRMGYSSEHSDLDLTVYKDSKPGWPLRKFASVFHGCKIGETTLFCSSDKQWLHLANPCEISRDPLLLREMGCSPPNAASKAQAIVFLLRTHSSDKYLGNSLTEGSRRKKWAHHFALVHSLSGLPNNFLSLLNSETLSLAVEKNLRSILPNEISEWRANDPEKNEEIFRYVFPHVWIGKARQLELEISPLHSVTQSWDQIQEEQIKWEMWGLLSQVRKYDTAQNVIEHLRHLFLLLPTERKEVLDCNRFLAYLGELEHD